MRRWIISGVLGAAIAALAFWRRSLTRDGAVAAALVGGVTFARGGLPAAGALLAFFVSSSALSKVAEQRKAALPLAQAKGAERDAWQVLANGGVSTVCAALNQPAGLVGALAAAAADTWATELGLLARGAPRLITTLEKVPPGTSGGVTLEGLSASLAGACAVGASVALLTRDWRVMRGAVLGGLGGALADSLVGATLQAEYRCPHCDVPTEAPIHSRCGSPSDLVRGYAWITNDTVNTLATLTGALLGLALNTPNAAGHVRGGG